jgi:hypothetical protein
MHSDAKMRYNLFSVEFSRFLGLFSSVGESFVLPRSYTHGASLLCLLALLLVHSPGPDARYKEGRVGERERRKRGEDRRKEGRAGEERREVEREGRKGGETEKVRGIEGEGERKGREEKERRREKRGEREERERRGERKWDGAEREREHRVPSELPPHRQV